MKWNQTVYRLISGDDEVAAVQLIEEGQDAPAEKVNPFLVGYKVRPTITDAILDPDFFAMSFERFVLSELKVCPRRGA